MWKNGNHVGVSSEQRIIVSKRMARKRVKSSMSLNFYSRTQGTAYPRPEPPEPPELPEPLE